MPTLEWNIETCLEKCRPALLFDKTIKLPKTRIRRTTIVTLSEMQEAYKQIANIIAKYGDKYLPLFERLHSEISECRSKNDLLNIAKNIAHEKLSTEITSQDRVKNISHIFSHVSHTNVFH